MNECIRIGIIGLGWVSTHRHIPAIRNDPRYKIIGIADQDATLAGYWGKRLGIKFCQADSINKINWIDEVDAIDVATAPMSHYSLIQEALLSNKHVITEKPFTMSIQEGLELVKLAKQQQRHLAIIHNFQFSKAAQHLKKDIHSGRIGTIRSIIAMQWGNPARRLPTWYDTLPGGLFYDESPHLLYLVRHLSPGVLRLVSVDACASTLGHRTPASIDAAFRTENKTGEIPITVSCRFESPLSEWHVSVLGDNSVGILDVFRNIYLCLPNDNVHRAQQVVRTSLTASWNHWWQHILNGPGHLTGRMLYGNETVFSRFAQAIINNTPLNGISAIDALEVLKMQWDILDNCKSSWDKTN